MRATPASVTRSDLAHRAACPGDDTPTSLALTIHRRRRAAKLAPAWRETPESEAEGELVRQLLLEATRAG